MPPRGMPASRTTPTVIAAVARFTRGAGRVAGTAGAGGTSGAASPGGVDGAGAGTARGVTDSGASDPLRGKTTVSGGSPAIAVAIGGSVGSAPGGVYEAGVTPEIRDTPVPATEGSRCRSAALNSSAL